MTFIKFTEEPFLSTHENYKREIGTCKKQISLKAYTTYVGSHNMLSFMIIIQVDCYHFGRYNNEGITNSLTYQVLSCRYYKHPIEIVTFSNAQNSCDKVWFLNEL